jgi:LAO/AO transport system kinase
MWKSLPEKIRAGDSRALSRAISLVENEVAGYEDFLQQLPYNSSVKITGITGPPGAGKSTLVDCLIGEYVGRNDRVSIICIDPSSAFTGGALLGDRVRMREWYNHPNVYIRSLSTRGTLGGLNPGIVEITDIIRTAPCDHIIIETVGVGQNEIEIAALADTTVVVQVPEGGDDIQAMKAGLMEIADIIVVNKCDRPGAELFTKNLRGMLQEGRPDISIIKTTASENLGIRELANAITAHQENQDKENKVPSLMRRAMQLILKNKMKLVDTEALQKLLIAHYRQKDFNLYKLVSGF